MSFPKGLRVLVVAGADYEAIQAQLQCPELGYDVTVARSASEALSLCKGGVAAHDVVLAEASMVAYEEAVGRSFVDSFEDTPVVFMSEHGTTDAVMRAVKLGAVDFLDKPLSLLKLKNIWQHSVRKMMLKASGPTRSAAPAPGLCMSVAVAPPQTALAATAWPAFAASKPAVPAAPSAVSPPLATAPSAGPESPGTPSAVSGGDLPETFSMSFCSSGADSGAPSMRASMDCGAAGSAGTPRSESFVEALNSAIHAAPLPRPTSVTSLPSAPVPAAAPAAAPAPLLHAAPAAPHHWPALTPGCVWGTPANGPVPPPLPGVQGAWGPLQTASAAPVLIKGNAPAAPAAPLLPAPIPASSPDAVAPPEGFLLNGPSNGPLGLKLRKTPSLLNMINAALSSEGPAACPGGMGVAPMVC